ncbi:hypothetical protein D3C71_1908990 [compost metagenome]
MPDSDFLAWDRLVSAFPARPEPVNDGGVAERLWRRLATRLGAEPWRMCALRLHAGDGQGLSASLASLSALGASAARHIAHVEGADGELWIDDCCCAGAARQAPSLREPAQAPLIRL